MFYLILNDEMRCIKNFSTIKKIKTYDHKYKVVIWEDSEDASVIINCHSKIDLNKIYNFLLKKILSKEKIINTEDIE